MLKKKIDSLKIKNKYGYNFYCSVHERSTLEAKNISNFFPNSMIWILLKWPNHMTKVSIVVLTYKAKMFSMLLKFLTTFVTLLLWIFVKISKLIRPSILYASGCYTSQIAYLSYQVCIFEWGSQWAISRGRAPLSNGLTNFPGDRLYVVEK